MSKQLWAEVEDLKVKVARLEDSARLGALAGLGELTSRIEAVEKRLEARKPGPKPKKTAE